MPEIPYLNAAAISILAKLGESPSIFDFTTSFIGDGVADATPAFQRAIAAAMAKGAMQLHIPEGYTLRVTAPIVIPAGIRFRMWGRGTIKRGAAMPAGQGVIDIAPGASEWRLEGFRIDGDVTVRVGKQYGTFAGIGGDDPMHADLVQDSSIWIKPGNRDFVIDDVEVVHTGGYACIGDSRTGNVQDGRLRLRLRNCHPHAFGTDPGDLNYGAWTSGLFLKNDGRAGAGNLYSCRDLRIEIDAERITGSAFWMHSYGFDALHRNIRVDVKGRDIGRDAVLVGALAGGKVNCSARRVGYMTATDVDAPVPKWLANHYAVGVDSSGVVQGVDIEAELVSVCGGYVDLDGYSRGQVDVVCVKPEAGSAEYTEDDVASIPANVSYGAQVSDSSGNIGGQQVRISGTFKNLDGGAVRLFAAHGCFVEGCNIEHPATAGVAPIVIGNIGVAADQRSRDNVVRGNRIAWGPGAQAAAVQEWGAALGYAAFQATDRNWVAGNHLFGNCYEFLRAAESGSTTEVRVSTLSASATKSDLVIAREGTGEDSYTSFYRQIGAAAGDLISRWYDRFPLGGGLYGGPLLNVSKNGTAKSGSVALGDAVSLSFDHAFYGGKVLAEAFLAAKNYAAYTGADTAANTLSDDWALLRWNKTAVKWQQSVSVAAGARVWTDFASGGTPGGANTQVQYNDAGAFAGEAALAWDKTLKRQTVTGLTGTAGLVLNTCFLQGDQGVLMVRNDGGSCYTLQRTAATAAIYQHAVGSDGQYYFLRADAGGATYSFNSIGAATTQVRLGQAGSGDRQNILDFVSDAGIYGMRLDRAAGANGAGALFFRGAGGFFIVCEDSSGIAFYTSNTPRFSIGGLDGIFRNGNDSFRVDQSGNIAAVTSALTNAIQAPSGGVTAKWLIATDSLFFTEIAAPALSALGQARLYVDSTSHKLRISANGAAYVDVGGSGGTPGGANTQVQYNASGAFAGSANFTWNNGAQQLAVAGVGGTAAIDVTSGYMQSSGGFASLNSAATALNLPNGGATALVFISTRTDGDDSFIVNTSVRDWGLRSGGDGYLVVYDRTSGASRWQFRGDGDSNLVSGNLRLAGNIMINSSGQFVGFGVDVGANGISGGGYNISGGFFGQTLASLTLITALQKVGNQEQYKSRVFDFRGGVATAIGAESGWTNF